MRKLGIVIILLFTITLPGYTYFNQLGFKPKMKNEIKYEGFSVEYNIDKRIAEYSYYAIEGSKLDSYPRYKFWTDIRVPDYPEVWEYYSSGYDRGHLFPNGSSMSYKSSEDSFSMINMVPQKPSFNRGLWKKLEIFEQNNSDPIIYIASGIILTGKEKELDTGIPIPEFFYKVMYNPNKGMIAFLVSQRSDNSDIGDYLVTVDKIEELTGIDFYPQLPDSDESRLESTFDFSKWY